MTKVILNKPIPYGKDTLAEITLREPLAGDLRGIKLREVFDLDPAALATILPRIATPALTAAHINQMTVPDMMEVYKEVVSFFGTSNPDLDFQTTPPAVGA